MTITHKKAGLLAVAPARYGGELGCWVSGRSSFFPFFIVFFLLFFPPPFFIRNTVCLFFGASVLPLVFFRVFLFFSSPRGSGWSRSGAPGTAWWPPWRRAACSTSCSRWAPTWPCSPDPNPPAPPRSFDSAVPPPGGGPPRRFLF